VKVRLIFDVTLTRSALLEARALVRPPLVAPTRAVSVDDQANASAADQPCGDVQELFHGP
jgi:hypothetical protein